MEAWEWELIKDIIIIILGNRFRWHIFWVDDCLWNSCKVTGVFKQHMGEKMVFIKKEVAQRPLSWWQWVGSYYTCLFSRFGKNGDVHFKPSLTGDLGHRMEQRLRLIWKPLRLSLVSYLIGYHIPRYGIERWSMSAGFCLRFHDQEFPGCCYVKWTGKTQKLLIRQFQGLNATKTGIWIVIIQNRERRREGTNDGAFSVMNCQVCWPRTPLNWNQPCRPFLGAWFETPHSITVRHSNS